MEFTEADGGLEWIYVVFGVWDLECFGLGRGCVGGVKPAWTGTPDS
jgi:hypothetical protein